MTYTRKVPPPYNVAETDRQYLLRLMKENPRGYSGMLHASLPNILIQIDDQPYDTPGERTYTWVYQTKPPECVATNCNNITNFKQFSEGYYRFCSSSCRATTLESNKNGLTDTAIEKRKQWRQSLTPSARKQLGNKIKNSILANNGENYYVAMGATNSRRLSASRPTNLNDRDWLQEEHKTKSLAIIAHEQGTTWDIVRNAVDRHGDIERFYHTATSVGEQEIVEFVVAQELTPSLNNRNIIPPHELDIFLPELNIAIEYCGLYWHSTKVRTDIMYHVNKFRACKEKGINLITIFEDEWINNRTIVENRLLHLLNKTSRKIYARKTIVVELTKQQSKQFFCAHHLQGNAGCSITYGLLFDGNIVAAMSFGVPRYNKRFDYEIIRFASVCSVVGGGSKLFTHFVKTHTPTNVITYADNRWGDGSSYTKYGFSLIEQTKPSYYYVKAGTLKRHHRSQFMKHKIVELGGDPNLTEFENMDQMKYLRIYDCGTTKYCWTGAIDITCTTN
jgi:hypothetical protein